MRYAQLNLPGTINDISLKGPKLYDPKTEISFILQIVTFDVQHCKGRVQFDCVIKFRRDVLIKAEIHKCSNCKMFRIEVGIR